MSRVPTPFEFVRRCRTRSDAAVFRCDSHAVRALHGTGRQASFKELFL